MKKLLGLDVGTTSMKAGLYDENLNELATASVEYTLISSGDRVEFDADEYVTILEKCMDAVTGGELPDAISLDTQCETMILTDREGKPLRNAIVWLDNRAALQAGEIEKKFGKKKVYETTGQAEIAAAWPACKLLWIKENEPEVWEKTEKVFLLGDWLTYKLTGNFVTEGTLQSSSIYFDINQGNWWGEMLDFIGLDTAKLPEIRKTTALAGYYKGVPVIVGAMDQVAGAVGMGVTGPGRVSEMTGTTLAVFAPCTGIPPYEEGSIIPCHYNYDGSCCRLMWTSAAGLALKWFRDGFCSEASYRELDGLAEAVPAGCGGLTFVPHLCGETMPVCNPSSKGAFCGIGLEHGKAHFARAVMESVAFMLRECLDCLPLGTDQIRSSGGGSRSPLWCRIKSDVTGKRIVTMKKGETATLGSAVFAGVGIGVFPSVPEAAELIETAEEYCPSGTDYSGAYERYQTYCRRVNPV